MKKVLCVWGGWDGHEPKQGIEIFARFLERKGYEVRVEHSLDVYTEEDYMRSLTLVVQAFTMASISDEQLSGLLAAVRAGVGIAGWHGGLCDSFRERVEYHFMTGGQWVAHPGGIVDYTVNVTNPDDPIMAGIGDFSLHSEQYYLLVDPGNDVLATTTFAGAHEGIDWIKGCVMPVVWKRRYGKGRVFYSSLGHVAADLAVSEVRTIFERGMLWAAGESGLDR